jgi:hypothetical protein
MSQANQYSDPFKHVPPSDKQKRQRQLAWALRICMGFYAAMHMIPRDLKLKSYVRNSLNALIDEIRAELRNIK